MSNSIDTNIVEALQSKYGNKPADAQSTIADTQSVAILYQIALALLRHPTAITVSVERLFADAAIADPAVRAGVVASYCRKQPHTHLRLAMNEKWCAYAYIGKDNSCYFAIRPNIAGYTEMLSGMPVAITPTPGDN